MIRRSGLNVSNIQFSTRRDIPVIKSKWIKRALIVFGFIGLSNSVQAGCDAELTDAELQVASGMNAEEIRNLIKLAKQDVGEKTEQASSR